MAGDLVISTGRSSGGFQAQRATTGVAVRHYPTVAPTLSPPIVAAGTLIASDSDGYLYAF